MKRILSPALALVFASAFPSLVDADVLGTARSFAVLAGTTVTNTGFSTITGDLGVSPGTAVTGFPPGIVTGGTIHSADAVALQAQSDLTTAYNSLAGMAPDQDLTGQDLGGLTLAPGVYFFASSAQLTGTLTLDTQGDPNALFVFQIGSTLTTASNSSVVTINGPNECNVYWQIGSSATLGTGTTFQGNILALTSITLTTGTSIVSGRALAQNGAVTLDDVNVVAGCRELPPPIIDCVGNQVTTIRSPLQFTICASDPDPSAVVTLTATNLPVGATVTPSLPASGNPICVTVNFMARADQVGQFLVTFTATSASGSVSCNVLITVAEVSVVFGKNPGTSQHMIYNQMFDTQIDAVNRVSPATEALTPEFVYALLPRTFTVQVLMHNPFLFPLNPNQHSYAVRVTKGAGNTITVQNFGTENNIVLTPFVYVDVNGVRRVRFAFDVAGM